MTNKERNCWLFPKNSCIGKIKLKQVPEGTVSALVKATTGTAGTSGGLAKQTRNRWKRAVREGNPWLTRFFLWERRSCTWKTKRTGRLGL